MERSPPFFHTVYPIRNHVTTHPGTRGKCLTTELPRFLAQAGWSRTQGPNVYLINLAGIKHKLQVCVCVQGRFKSVWASVVSFVPEETSKLWHTHRAALKTEQTAQLFFFVGIFLAWNWGLISKPPPPLSHTHWKITPSSSTVAHWHWNSVSLAGHYLVYLV